uniref:Activin_recp domain-containing protein n=1 Tax=Elaeophora elaphi TaxID=1147741 RepID=A0A0R3S0K7_9BILA
MISNITEEEVHPVGAKFDQTYCSKNIEIRSIQEDRVMSGTLCCCNHDWCNVNYEDEPPNDLDRIFELDHGTERDYMILKEIAAKYGLS